MLLVVDANVIFSSLIADGGTFNVFLLNKDLKKFEFIAPEFLFIEVEEHFNEIVEKTKRPPSELKMVLGFLEKEIELIPFEEFRHLYAEAEKISPDQDDVQYFALSLKLGCAIWSNDKAMQKQSAVKVFATKELARFLG